MTKERIKTLILTTLVLCSVVLTTQIWFNEKLWSEGYDFFSVFKDNLGWNNSSDDASLSITDTGAFSSIFAPNTILFSNRNGRVVHDSSTGKGTEATLVINDVIKSALSCENISTVTEDEWKSVIKSTNIYADYNVPVSVSAIGSFLEADIKDLGNFSSFDKIIIDTGKYSNSIIPVYFRDSSTNSYYRINTPFSKDSLTGLSSDSSPALNLAYSFELGLDTKAEGEASKHQSVLLDSYVLLNLDETAMNTITEEKPDLMNSESVNSVLEAFGFNKKTVRKFSQTDGTQNFINSKATLIISPAGYIEYSSVSEDSGFSIGEDSDITTSAAGSARLIDKILNTYKLNPGTKLFITSPLTEIEQGTHTLTFSYLYDAIKIRSASSDCIVEVKNGKITYLKLYVKNFVEYQTDAPTHVLDIIEKVYTKNKTEGTLYIRDLSTGYVQYGNVYKKIWLVSTNQTEEPIIIE